jgi:signal transduction histidine kinase
MRQRVRFDDSLKTVLAADASTAFGAQATFRQLADLMARGRVPADDETLGRLRMLRDEVPAAVRAAAARGLALGRPPSALVGLFAEDEPEIASAALRVARLTPEGWITLLPRLGPAARATLRRRDDLDPAVVRALESFGATDFVIGYAPQPPVDRPVPPPVGLSPFVAIGAIADTLPVVATARQAAQAPQPLASGGFEIAELVDRIASFQRDRAPTPAGSAAALDSFRFETDGEGAISWTDGVPRGSLIGLRLAVPDGAAQVDGVIFGAFRQRAEFADARLTLVGASPLAGDWRMSAIPIFDPTTGRFAGYRGSARRPRVHEEAARSMSKGGAEGLRRLVHELRTPTNAIAGFSELIEAQLLGPVAPVYRERATAIRGLAADLIAAIEDLDLAARIEGDALQLKPGMVMIAPLLGRIVGELQALAGARGCALVVAPMDASLAVNCDDRAVERLFARLIATFVSAGQSGETISVAATRAGQDRALVTITCPRALTNFAEDRLLALDAEREAELPGAPLLGTGFALRLVRNLATGLGGQFAVAGSRCSVTLPTLGAEAPGHLATN